MKNRLKINLILFVIGVLLFSECNWIDTDLNIDPDSPSDVTMDLLLPSLQTSSAYTIGGNTAVRVSNIWMQFFDGVSRQSTAEVRYIITSADVNNFWETLYSQSMPDCKKLISKADEQNSPHYAGIAKVMMALNLGTLTNFFGDIPYSEALDGSNAVLQPDYDSQESIYASIESLLDEAINDLADEENAVDVSGDIVYTGDLDMWTKAVYALKARYALYLKDYTAAISFADLSFEFAEDFSFPFEASESGANPIYQFMRDRTDIRMASTFIDILHADADPRLSFYAYESDYYGAYAGSIPGTLNSAASLPGSYNASPDSPVIFSSYSEMQFVKAEAIYRRDGAFNEDALTAYRQAVSNSVLVVTGDGNQSWLDANINNETVGTLTLEDVITQKYLAMYSTVIPYDDWRRTACPTLLIVENAVGDLPERFPYPQSEITYNANCPSGVTTDEVLWIFQ